MRMQLALLLLLTTALAPVACTRATEVELYVDGFEPENVRFEVEDLGPLDAAALAAVRARPDVDGALTLPEGSCPQPCRAALVSVFVNNFRQNAQPEPAPVVRLKSPAGKPARAPIAFRGGAISPGRVGRIRWLVQMWPQEQSLTATLSSSVELVAPPATPAPVTTPPSPTVTP